MNCRSRSETLTRAFIEREATVMPRVSTVAPPLLPSVAGGERTRDDEPSCSDRIDVGGFVCRGPRRVGFCAAVADCCDPGRIYSPGRLLVRNGSAWVIGGTGRLF